MADTAGRDGPKSAIVVGAGVGGVATAARLAKAGFEVIVLEKNGFTGGRCSLLHHEGYRFDQGPSLLLLPKLFQETFHDLSTSLPDEGVELLRCEPNYHLWFGDGESFELSSNMAVMKLEVEKWEGKAGFQRYLAWLSEAHAHYEISVAEVLHKNFTSIFHLGRWNFFSNVIALHPFESIYSRASRYFHSERLRRVFTFGSMYMGMSPFDAPGGFHAVVAALVRIGERLGVTYRLNAPVSSVVTSSDGKTATGVVLESGEMLSADVVVVNADLVYAYNNLFSTAQAEPNLSKSSPRSPGPSSYAQSLTKRAGSCSSVSFYWALSRQVPQLTTHNIFLADSYKESFDAIFKRQSIPSEPSFYVNVPSRIDPSAAPPGCESIVVLVPCGHLPQSRTSGLSNGRSSPETSTGHLKESRVDAEQDWDTMVSTARSKILSTISTRLSLPPSLLSSSIIHEQVNTPRSWERTFNLDKGAILGLSHSFFNVLSFRPGIRHKHLRNAYFVGASTHPGTGVPIVLAGAKMTAETILNDLRMPIPWRKAGKSWGDVLGDKGVPQGRSTKQIDRLHLDGWRYAYGALVAFLVLVLALTLARSMRVKGEGSKGYIHPCR